MYFSFLRPKFFLVGLFFSSIVFVSPSHSTAQGLCKGAEATLECLKKNFDQLYQSDYDQWSSLLTEVQIKAEACTGVSDTAGFIELFIGNENNAEFTEYFSGTMERLCSSNIPCCLNATLILGENTQRALMAQLANPTFFEETTFSKAFLPYKDKEKYKKLLRFFFSR